MLSETDILPALETLATISVPAKRRPPSQLLVGDIWRAVSGQRREILKIDGASIKYLETRPEAFVDQRSMREWITKLRAVKAVPAPDIQLRRIVSDLCLAVFELKSEMPTEVRAYLQSLVRASLE